MLWHINDYIDGDIYQIPNFKALRMPLYFVLSVFFKGYVYRIFLMKKINNIIVPFLFWLIISDIWRILSFHANVDLTIIQFIKDPLCRVIKSNGALWFLMCLFTTNMIFYFINLILKDNKRICIAVWLFAMLSYLLLRYDIQLPLWIDSLLTALPFFYFGYYCKKSPWLEPNYSIKKRSF